LERAPFFLLTVKCVHELLAKIKPADLVALVITVGGLVLKLRGADGVVGSLLVMVAAYYFGKEHATKTNPDVQP